MRRSSAPERPLPAGPGPWIIVAPIALPCRFRCYDVIRQQVPAVVALQGGFQKLCDGLPTLQCTLPHPLRQPLQEYLCLLEAPLQNRLLLSLQPGGYTGYRRHRGTASPRDRPGHTAGESPDTIPPSPRPPAGYSSSSTVLVKTHSASCLCTPAYPGSGARKRPCCWMMREQVVLAGQLAIADEQEVGSPHRLL